MVKQEDLKHEWTVSANSWYIKLYAWVWIADVEQVNFCKLFWAYFFMPFGLLIIRPLFFVLTKLDEANARRREARSRALDEHYKQVLMDMDKEPTEKEPSRGEKFLDLVANLFVRISMRMSAVAAFVGRHLSWLRPLLPVFIATLFLLSCGALVYLLVTISIDWLEFFKIAAFVVAGIAAMLGIVTLLIRVFEQQAEKPKKAKTMTFRKAMKKGYKAVKTNTCPRINVVD